MRGSSLLTAGLLSAILVGIIVMPRFNHETLALRLTALELERKKLEQHVRRLEEVTGLGTDGARLAATVDMLRAIPELVQSAQDGLGAASSWTPTIPRTIEDLEHRVKALEEASGAEVLPPGEEAGPSGEFPPVDLSPELRERADRFSARATAEGHFEGFLSHAVDAGLLESLDDLDPETHKALFRIFSLYKLDIGLINYEENFHVRELAELAAEVGDYTEVPIAIDEESLRRVTVTQGGIVHLQNINTEGVRRIYRFPADEFPEFEEYTRQRENARDRMVKDVATLVGTAEPVAEEE